MKKEKFKLKIWKEKNFLSFCGTEQPAFSSSLLNHVLLASNANTTELSIWAIPYHFIMHKDR